MWKPVVGVMPRLSSAGDAKKSAAAEWRHTRQLILYCEQWSAVELYNCYTHAGGMKLGLEEINSATLVDSFVCNTKQSDQTTFWCLMMEIAEH